MKKFVALHYIPGATGNFLSRCINLLDNTYVWAKNGQIPTTLEGKMEILSYKDLKIGINGEDDWTVFENQLLLYHTVQPHYDIDNNGIAVFPLHPKKVDTINKFAGADDQKINILVDHTDRLAWCLVNGYNKNSFQSLWWFKNAETLKNDPSVYKIDLVEIISGYERFYVEFLKLSQFLERNITPEIESALKTLYKEWFATTLQDNELERNRQEIIEILTNILELLKNNDPR